MPFRNLARHLTLIVSICGPVLPLPSAAQTAAAPPLQGVNLAGAAFSPTVLPGVYGQDFIFPNLAEITYFTAKGMNIFRISILWERLQPVLSGPLDADQLARLQAFIQAANQQHAAVIIDIHNYGSYRGIDIGQAPVTNAAFADLWSKLATDFGQNNNVLFGLMNEPQILGPDAWRNSVQGAIDAIRRTGAVNRILVSGTAWDSAAGFATVSGSSLGSLQDPRHKLIYEVHEYFDADASGTSASCIDQPQAIQRLIPFTQWLRAHKQHGFLGEFGVGPRTDCLALLGGVMAYLKANADVWAGWTYWAAGPAWGSYMFSIEPGPGQDRPQMAVLEKYLAPGTR